MSSRVVGLFAILLLCAGMASASTITILNSSFESPSCGIVGPVSCVPANWVLTGTLALGGQFLPPSNAWDSIPDGVQVGWSNGGTLTQNLGVNVLPDLTYTLSLWLSQRWTAGTFLPEVQLLGGATPLFTMNNSNPGGAAPSLNQDGTYSWVFWSMSWTAPSSGAIIGQPLSIFLGSDGIQTDFDNLSLTTSAPEPGMLVLVAGGLLAIGVRRRLTK